MAEPARERPQASRSRRMAEDIKQAFEDSRQTYGTRRIQDDWDKQGQRVSRIRIGRLMRQEGLRCKTRRQFRATTNSNHTLPVAPNRLDRQFQGVEPDRVYVGDITYVATGEGWLYLAVFLDLFSRQVVGWAMSAWMTADLVIVPCRWPAGAAGLAKACWCIPTAAVSTPQAASRRCSGTRATSAA
jgi:putative transposase